MTDGVTAPEARLDMVDGLRGYALLGLFLVHMNELFELYWAVMPPQNVFHDWVFGIFAGKAYAIFAFCFGFSVFVMMDGAAKRGVDFTGRLAWRLLILFGIGWLHGLVYRGDIITVLSVLGLAMLAINRVKSVRWLWVIAVFFFLQPWNLFRIACALSGQAWANAGPNFANDPAMAVYLNGDLIQTLAANVWTGQVMKWWFMFESGRMSQILGLFVVGLIFGRIGFFAAEDRFRTARRVAIAAVLVAALTFRELRDPLSGALFPNGLGGADWVWGMTTGAWVDLGWTMLSVLGFVEIWRLLKGRGLGVLAPAGRMTLTLYIAQSLVFVPVFYSCGLGGYATIGQTQAFWIGVVAFAIQLVFAGLWFRRFRYGPLEWGLRSATWMRRVEMRAR